MFTLGLTGGIGSGKSAVSDIFSELGVQIVDADLVARHVVELGQPALNTITQHFGSAILLADGNLNRAKLRQIIFAQPEEKIWLETLLHPLIREQIKRQLDNANSSYVILSSPLLLETKQHHLTNRVLVVDVKKEVQIQRACLRDQNNEAQIKAIMANQMSREQRLNHADDVLDNNSSLANTRQQVELLHAKYLLMAK